MELFIATQILSPPEPRSVIFVPRTEDDGYRLSLFILQRTNKISHTCHPSFELIVISTSRQDVPHNRCIFHIPGGTLRELLRTSSAIGSCGHRITRMPAQCHDTTTLYMGQQLVVNTGKGHTIEVLIVAHFDATQVEAHHGRIITNGQLYITLSIFVGPTNTIEWIVLMTSHIAFVQKFGQSCLQLLGDSLLCAGLLSDMHLLQ